jgi:hypothetical protein
MSGKKGNYLGTLRRRTGSGCPAKTVTPLSTIFLLSHCVVIVPLNNSFKLIANSKIKIFLPMDRSLQIRFHLEREVPRQSFRLPLKKKLPCHLASRDYSEPWAVSGNGNTFISTKPYKRRDKKMDHVK